MPDNEDKPQEPEAPPLREIPKEELQLILAAHKRGVESEHKEGERASLNYTNLQGAVLYKANLQGANLWKANLQGANLWNANLQGANLWNAKLQGASLNNANLENADFLDAKLEGADLRNATLKGAKSLLAEQLAGLDLTGAKLPEDIHKFDGPLKVVEDASKHARYIFFSMLMACVYALLTISSHTDKIILPMLNVNVSPTIFYLTAPFLIFLVYLYFHYYMQGLWEKMAKLPAIFPDGYPMDEKVYPWFLNCIVRAHVKRLRKDKTPPMFKRKYILSFALAWGAAPLTLLIFWLVYLPHHFLPGTAIHILLIAGSIGFGVESYRVAAATLGGDGERFRTRSIDDWTNVIPAKAGIQRLLKSLAPRLCGGDKHNE